MKIISFIVLQIIAVIAANVTFIWAIIEFILYIAKDKVFNWWSVWGFVISTLIAIVLTIFAAVSKVKTQNKAWNEMKQRQSTVTKSRFQQRLEEMQAARKSGYV